MKKRIRRSVEGKWEDHGFICSGRVFVESETVLQSTVKRLKDDDMRRDSIVNFVVRSTNEPKEGMSSRHSPTYKYYA